MDDALGELFRRAEDLGTLVSSLPYSTLKWHTMGSLYKMKVFKTNNFLANLVLIGGG